MLTLPRFHLAEWLPSVNGQVIFFFLPLDYSFLNAPNVIRRFPRMISLFARRPTVDFIWIASAAIIVIACWARATNITSIGNMKSTVGNISLIYPSVKRAVWNRNPPVRTRSASPQQVRRSLCRARGKHTSIRRRMWLGRERKEPMACCFLPYTEVRSVWGALCAHTHQSIELLFFSLSAPTGCG